MFSDDFLGGERDPREDPHRVWEDPLGTAPSGFAKKVSGNIEKAPRVYFFSTYLAPRLAIKCTSRHAMDEAADGTIASTST